MWRTLALAALIAVAGSAQAEVNEVRMSKQFGLPYLPMIVIEAQQLIEKNARAAGLGDVATNWTQRAGPAADLDALLAGQADFIGPGVPTLATIWDKTVGTPQEARALIAMQSMPYVLVTRNPNVKTIADFTDKDKIALPAVKLTGHAIALEMEAARIWGRIISTSSTPSPLRARMRMRRRLSCRANRRSIRISPARRFITTNWRRRAFIRCLNRMMRSARGTPMAFWSPPRNSTMPIRNCAARWSRRSNRPTLSSRRIHARPRKST